MDIHRVANVGKDRDETYRQTQYKRSGRSKSSGVVLAEDINDISDIRKVSAELNRFSAMFDMKSFNEVKEKLSNIISELENSDIKIANILKTSPSEEIVKLSRMADKDK